MNNNSKSWISCTVILIIVAIVLTVLRWFGWLLFPAIIIINLVRAMLWRRKVMNAQQDKTYDTPSSEEKARYCEAEFEILDDESDEDE